MSKTRSSRGSGLINKIVDNLPFEAHLPGGYRFCGPGTRLSKRLARGDKGINELDEACKLHDISYAQSSDSGYRQRADADLAERAWQRFKDPKSSLGEKTASWLVTTAMKAKGKLGGRIKKGGKKKKVARRGKGLYLRPYPKTGEGIRKRGKRRKTRSGGALPLLPIFAGLSALGSLAGGAASVAKVINDIKNTPKQPKTGGRLSRRKKRCSKKKN